MILKIRQNKFVRYLIVGSLNNFLNFIVFKFLIFFKIQIFYSASGGFIAGSLLSYFLNSKFTFKTKKRTNFQFALFLILQIFLLNIFSLIVSFSKLYFFSNDNLSWCFATSVILIVNFVMQRKLFNLSYKNK